MSEDHRTREEAETAALHYRGRFGLGSWLITTYQTNAWFWHLCLQVEGVTWIYHASPGWHTVRCSLDSSAGWDPLEGWGAQLSHRSYKTNRDIVDRTDES